MVLKFTEEVFWCVNFKDYDQLTESINQHQTGVSNFQQKFQAASNCGIKELNEGNRSTLLPRRKTYFGKCMYGQHYHDKDYFYYKALFQTCQLSPSG